jgi:hypothetical protein
MEPLAPLPGPVQHDNTYTVVREADGVPIGTITALNEEAAQAQKQNGMILVPGHYLGRWHWDGSQMVEAPRDFAELKQSLKWKILDAYTVLSGEDVQTAIGPVSPGGESLTMLLLGAANGHGQPFRFSNGQERFLLREQLGEICAAVYQSMFNNRMQQEKDLASVNNAGSRAELTELLTKFWPDEGTT